MAQAMELGSRPTHFIGIGGIGMSALAQILLHRGLPVSGSDPRATHITRRLEDQGARVFQQQVPENFDHWSGELRPQVVCSTAIAPSNPEYAAALERGFAVFHRSDLLAALIADYRSVAVAGTHGKTTTSGMIAFLLQEAGLDPTVVIGGEVTALGGNARVGDGEFLVAEADESDGSLVKFHPAVGVITNIELDHPDHYQDLASVRAIFEEFAAHCGILVSNWDCPNLRQYLPGQLSYSLDAGSGADYRASDIRYAGDGTRATVHEREQLLGELYVPLLEAHNLSNALAAVAVGRKLGLGFDTIAEAIARYEGARRRFDFRGAAAGIQFVDDYAHHPTELVATLAAARLQVETGCSRLPEVPQRIVAVFQPHRYSRTRAFLNEFAASFGAADCVVLCDVYSAGEAQPADFSGASLAEAIAAVHPRVSYQPSLDEVRQHLQATLQPGDLALFLGAGNLNSIIPDLVEHFTQATA